MTTRIETNWSIAFADPSYTITYASTYDAEVLNADCATIVASTRNSDILLINNTALKYSKCTSPSEASRSALITAIAALNVEAATTPDNHYIITTKAEFDTAITDATTAAVPYRFEIAAGTYAFTAQVVFPADGTIIGAGERATILTTTNEASDGAFKVASINCEFRDLTFNHLDNGNSGAAYGLVSVYPDADQTVKFTRCRFTQFDAVALEANSGLGEAGFVVDVINCTFDEPHTSGADTALYVTARGAGNVRTKGCIFKDVDYGYYSATGTISPNEEVSGCIFDNNATNPLYSTIDQARSISIINNEFRDCAGDIVLPTTHTNITDFTFGGNMFDNFTGTKPMQVGDSVSDTLTANLNFSNDTLTKTFLSLNDLAPGTYLFTLKAMLTDLDTMTQAAVILDNSGGTGHDVTSGTGFTDKIVGESQICNNGGVDVDFTRTFVVVNTGTNDYHAVVAARTAPGNTTTRAVTAEQTGSLVTVGDNICVLSAVRIS